MKDVRSIFAWLLPAFLWAMSCTDLKGQDLYFSQFHEAPMVRNPALAGLFEGDIRVQGVYRNQWNSISFPYQTVSVNMEYKFALKQSDDFLTIGAQMLQDKAGTVALTTNHLLPVVNYHKSISEKRNTYLSLGFMGGLVNRRLDRARVTTNNQYDGFTYNGSLPDGEMFNAGYNYLDATVGLSLSSTLGQEEQHLFFIGMAYHHFNKPVNSFYRNINHLPKWVFSGGLKVNIGPASYMTFHGDYLDQKPHRQIIGGGIYSHKLGSEDQENFTFHTGMFMRWGDALIPMVKMDISKLSMSFSYDVTVGKLATATQTRGGFEFALSYKSYLGNDKSAQFATKCPRF